MVDCPNSESDYDFKESDYDYVEFSRGKRQAVPVTSSIETTSAPVTAATTTEAIVHPSDFQPTFSRVWPDCRVPYVINRDLGMHNADMQQ